VTPRQRLGIAAAPRLRVLKQVAGPTLPHRLPTPYPAQFGGNRIDRLPLPLTSFVGREGELVKLTGWLRDPAGPGLLTLTGAGGCGKSRLALEIAREVSREPILTTLIRVLGSRQILLLLDNCEHLIDACARAAEELLTGCPRLTFMATSREALRIGGEVIWQVPSLSCPPTDASLGNATDRVSFLAPFEAVQLFVERASTVRPSFAVTHHNALAIAEIAAGSTGSRWRLSSQPHVWAPSPWSRSPRV
jgi:hypothetical protein